MTVETRYKRSDTHTINGLLAYQLGIAQSAYVLFVASNGAVANLDDTKRPTSDEYKEFPFWYPTPDPYHYARVNEVIADDYGSYVRTGDSTSYVYDRYGKPAYSLPVGKKVAMVRVVARVMTDALDARRQADIAFGIYVDGAYHLSSAKKTTDAWKTYTQNFIRNPATGQEWTEATINDIQLALKGRSYFSVDYYYAYCTQIYMEVYVYTDVTVYYSIDVIKRNSVGTETTLESKVAEVSSLISGLYNSPGLKNGSHLMSLYSLASTDSIVIKVYQKIGAGAWNLVRTWTTEQLGAESLDVAIWTVYYYLDISVTTTMVSTVYWHGRADYNSRIENFTWTPVVAPPPAKPLINKPLTNPKLINVPIVR